MVDGKNVHGNRFRTERFKNFIKILEDVHKEKKSIKVLDVGGRVAYWEELRDLWAKFDLKITIVNIEKFEADPHGPYECHYGDACNIDFPDHSFDVVHSNSVIEHVGLWSNVRGMAQEITRLAPRYYVQTPNFWFPIELHYRTPLIHFAPESVRAALLLRRGFGFFRKAEDMDEAMNVVQGIHLLTAGQMRELFPQATLKREKFFGFTKSLIAIR